MDEEPDLSDERAVELSSLSAIYPELEVEPGPQFKASLSLPVAPSTPLRARFARNKDRGVSSLPTPPTSVGSYDEASDDARQQADDDDDDIQYLSSLPPLRLGVELPHGYPSTRPPIFDITTHPSWLPETVVSRLLTDAVKLWEEFGRDMMVYSYIDHLQQCTGDAFGLLRQPGNTVWFSKDLKPALLDFDRKAQQEKFERETFVCGICLEPKKGSHCHRLPLCSHVFCIKCLQDFFTSCIQEGDVASVKCADPGCGTKPPPPAGMAGAPEDQFSRRKRDCTLNPHELLQVPLGPAVVQRYAFLKRKNRLELDKTTIYCPRKWCQGAARSKRHPKPSDPINEDSERLGDEESESPGTDHPENEDRLPPPSERLAVCEDCEYAFCRVCKRGWHGEYVYCYPRDQQELTEEEKATVDYMETYTAACPTCNARCQKSHGCNHMICFKCGSHFCYLCSSWLFRAQPYKHFNTPSSPCYMRLWEGEAGSGPPAAPDPPTDDDDDLWDAMIAGR